MWQIQSRNVALEPLFEPLFPKVFQYVTGVKNFPEPFSIRKLLEASGMACKWSLPLTSCVNPHVQAACPLALQPLQLAHLHAQFTRVPAQALRALGCQWVSSKPKGSSKGSSINYVTRWRGRGGGVRAGVTLRFLGGGIISPFSVS